jgi:peroxiredoxin
VDFQEQGVTLIGINPNDDSRYPDDSFENMKAFSAEHQLNFPYVRDVSQDVARSFGADRTPEVFLLDQDGIVRYSGLIDDSAQDAGAAKELHLRKAIAEVLAGSSVTVSSTGAIGCSLKWRQ